MPTWPCVLLVPGLSDFGLLVMISLPSEVKFEISEHASLRPRCDLPIHVISYTAFFNMS